MDLWKGAGRPYSVAHRAGGGDAPENTIAAAEKAVAAGARVLQIDAMLSKDGVAVCFHDQKGEDNLRKLCGLPGRLRDLDVTAGGLPQLLPRVPLNALCDGGELSTRDFGADGCQLCTLDELLGRVRAPCLIEVWAEPEDEEELVAAVVAVMRRHGREATTILGHPFSAQVARFLDASAPDVARIYSAGEMLRLLLLSWCGLLRFFPSHLRGAAGRRVLNLPIITERWDTLVAKVKKVERPPLAVRLFLRALGAFFYCPRLVAQILNSPAEFARAEKLGVDGVMTDYVQAYASRL